MATKTSDEFTLKAAPLTQEAFAEFGDVLQSDGNSSFLINNDNCARFHNLSSASVDKSGHVGLNLFEGKHYPFPITLSLLERHPLGSQAFIPMSTDPFLVVVAPDAQGQPGKPHVFITNGKQGVNYFMNTWHGVLTPIYRQALFGVVDYIGDENNLEEFNLPQPYTIVEPG